MTSDKQEEIARLLIYLIAAIGLALFGLYGCDKQPQLSNAEDGFAENAAKDCKYEDGRLIWHRKGVLCSGDPSLSDSTNGTNMPASFFTNCERLQKQGSGWTESERQLCGQYGYYLVPLDIADPGPMQGQWMADLALPMNRR